MCRPTSKLSNYRGPIQGLYLGGSGAHPGTKLLRGWGGGLFLKQPTSLTGKLYCMKGDKTIKLVNIDVNNFLLCVKCKLPHLEIFIHESTVTVAYMTMTLLSDLVFGQCCL